jgi:hypothetical protein
MIISQAPIRDSLWRRALRQNKDAMVRQRNPADIDEQLFYEHLSDVLIPYVANLRRTNPFSGQLAMCLVDSASPHISKGSLRLLGENHVLIIAFPAHTTNIFQELDLVFFSA